MVFTNALSLIGNSGSIAAVDTNTHALHTCVKPNDAGILGSYSYTGTSTNPITAGLAAASPVFSFRYTGPYTALVKRVWMGAGNAGTTGFTAGIATFNLFVARLFTAPDTAGTAAVLTSNNGKLRTLYPQTGVGNIMIIAAVTLTPGTRTLDPQPLGQISVGVTATLGGTFVPAGSLLLDERAGEWPLILGQNEGFVVQATVPATGIWAMSLGVTWDELVAY